MDKELLKHSIKQWAIDDLEFSIVVHPSMGHHCGYVAFPDRPVDESSYHGILTYVPVHGGITYARAKDGAAYGFDCAHLDDEQKPWLRDVDWLTNECEHMAIAIIVASQFEDEYNANDDNETRAALLDRYYEALSEYGVGAEYHIQDNFGIMLNALAGKL